jgi:hypothetical protein
MTEQQARNVANVFMAAAVAGAAYYVMVTPRLRRTAWTLARAWVSGPLAVWAANEVRRAWAESAARPALPSARMR